jgi:hypothetical protein
MLFVAPIVLTAARPGCNVIRLMRNAQTSNYPERLIRTNNVLIKNQNAHLIQRVAVMA